MENGGIVIYTTDHDALNDLQRWISNEFTAISVDKGESVALGEGDLGIKVIFQQRY